MYSRNFRSFGSYSRENKALKRTIGTIICLLLVAGALFAQKPLFKVYIDSTEINKKAFKISACIKTSSGYFSILNGTGTKITLPEEINPEEIEAFRFVVNKDTIVFNVAKILEDVNMLPKEKRVGELNRLFNEPVEWVLYIDNIQYYIGDMAALAKKPVDNKSNYRDFKVYALKTNKLKYYIVKA